MKLYEVPRNTKIRVLEEGFEHQVLTFKHIDGMYSFCFNDKGQVVHLAAWTDVEIVRKEKGVENS